MDTDSENCVFLLTSMIEPQDLDPFPSPDLASFPEDHESRVRWARENKRRYRYDAGQRNIDAPYVYCALSTVGLLDGEIALEGNARQRLFLSKTARAWGIPIDPAIVYRTLEFCSCPRLIIESVIEMLEQGHCPSEGDWATIVATLKSMHFDLNPEKVDIFPEKQKWWMQRLVVDLWFSP
jgi:hypothetical protein